MDLARRITAASLLNFQTGAGGDSAWTTFRVTGKNYAMAMNSLWTLKPNFMHTLEAPALTSAQRQHPIWFGPASQVEADITWHLPAGWSIDEAAPAIANDSGVARLDCRTETAAGHARVKFLLQRNGRLLPSSEYPQAQQLSRALGKIQGMTWVLKKS